MAWDPKSEGIAQIDGALSFLKSVRYLFKIFLLLKQMKPFSFFDSWIGQNHGCTV